MTSRPWVKVLGFGSLLGRGRRGWESFVRPKGVWTLSTLKSSLFRSFAVIAVPRSANNYIAFEWPQRHDGHLQAEEVQGCSRQAGSVAEFGRAVSGWSRVHRRCDDIA